MTATKPLEFRGASLALQSCREREFIISGPSETSKTWAALTLVDRLARENPKAQGAILRKVHRDLYGTVIKEFDKLFPGLDHYGGEKPEWYDYSNGARIWVGGLDRPGAFLSGALDFVYVNQAEELALEDWETLSTRTTGRAGVIVPGLLFGDCNPGPPTHWILKRPSLQILYSRHEDNPALYTADGQITEQGRYTLETLDKLTGVRRERLRFGRWVQAEGTVYEFNPIVHEVDALPLGSQNWPRLRDIDFGFANPFVCHWWAIDPDGAMWLDREIYMTGRTVTVHSRQINKLSAGEIILATVCDHDAEDRATLEENGIQTQPARKEISVGIEKVQERLKVQGNGRPRIFVKRGALVERDEALAAKHLPVCTRDEFDVYSYPKAADGKPLKEVPQDLNNHGMDGMRYSAMYLDKYNEPAGETINADPYQFSTSPY